MSKSTQLTSPIGFNVSSLRFSEPVAGEVPDSVPKIKFRRVNISVKNPDGTTGDLIIPTAGDGESNFSFGVSENVNQGTGEVNGYVFPICIYDKEGPTKHQEAFVATFDAIVDACKTHLLDNSAEIEQFELSMNDLKKLNPLYWKKEKATDPTTGKPVLVTVKGTGPVLYAKLIVSRKDGKEKILSQFYDQDTDEEVNPLTLLGKYCTGSYAIKIESLFVGGNGKISLQIKLVEACVKLLQAGGRRLLARPKVDAQVVVVQPTQSTLPLTQDNEGKTGDDNDHSDGEGSIRDEPRLLSESPPPSKVIRKVVKKKAK